MKMTNEIMLDIKAGKGLIDGILRSKIIKEDIYKLDLINVKTSLDQCKDVILNQLCDIDKMKNCSNCRHSATMSECGITHNKRCRKCHSQSMWQIENI
jgi:hypothetical protein